MTESKYKQSKATKKAAQTHSTAEEYVTVESFIRSARTIYPMTNLQVVGFKNAMASKGMKSAPGLEFYLPYLKHYLGIND